MMEERISEEENEDVFEDLQHEQREKHQPPMIDDLENQEQDDLQHEQRDEHQPPIIDDLEGPRSGRSAAPTALTTNDRRPVSPRSRRPPPTTNDPRRPRPRRPAAPTNNLRRRPPRARRLPAGPPSSTRLTSLRRGHPPLAGPRGGQSPPLTGATVADYSHTLLPVPSGRLRLVHVLLSM